MHFLLFFAYLNHILTKKFAFFKKKSYLCTRKRKSMESNRTIIHLEWKENREPKHEYFGSPASLFDKYAVSDLGIGRGALNNLYSKLSKDGKPQEYQNDQCIIRKGRLYCKPTDRGRKPSLSE